MKLSDNLQLSEIKFILLALGAELFEREVSGQAHGSRHLARLIATHLMQLMHFVGTVLMCLPFIAPAGQYFSQMPQPMHSLDATGYRGSAALFFLA